MKIVYIAGRFRGATAWDIEQNVRKAEAFGLFVASLGCMPLIPHTNTRFFQGQLTDEFWIEGTAELLRRADAIALVPGNWCGSVGTAGEIKLAIQRRMQIFSDPAENAELRARFSDLAHWIPEDRDLVDALREFATASTVVQTP